MSIPLGAVKDLRNPDAAARLQAQFGGNTQFDRDGSAYAHVGDRPIPPPKALRAIHAHRQEERQQKEDEHEAEEFAKAHGMDVKESRTALHFEDDTSAEAVQRRRALAQQDLEVRLCDTAYAYNIHGCGIGDCNGAYTYSTSFSHGAPVYQNKDGWTLHRGRPPVESTIGSGEEVTEFGWMLSKGGKPFYAVKTDEMLAPAGGWQCFYGPPPTPHSVGHTTWESHLLESCGPLKDAGNLAMSQGRYAYAQEQYSEALAKLDGYDDVVSASQKLAALAIALYANRAEACLRQQRWDQAFDDSKRVLDRDPTHVKAAVRLAKACRGLGRWSDAVVPLGRLLDKSGPQGNAEVRALLNEAELLDQCESGKAKLAGLYSALKCFRDELNRGSGRAEELQNVVQAVVGKCRQLEETCGHDPGMQRDLGSLLQGMLIFDTAIAAVEDEDAAEWSIDLLGICLGPQLREDRLRHVLEALPSLAQRLILDPNRALEIVRRLLKHRIRQQCKVADAIIEAKGLLASCIAPWVQLLDARYDDEPDERVVEVLHELGAQVQRLDNLEALALAMFVECFVGKKVDKGVTGGFCLYLGGGVRQVVLDLLLRWSEDSRVLQSLAPQLVGRVWASTLAKLRRDAGVEVEKELPAGQGGKKALKLEWFKLKDVSTLRKGVGAFYPEELLVPLLDFLKAHLEATCERGCERTVQDGITARHPAEEWMDEVLDRPFAWGVLLPLAMAPPSVASHALSLLEAIINRHPHNEKLAKRLAGFLFFMPFLNLPWPQSQPAPNHLEATVALGPLARRSVCTVLRCTIDTEMGLRVARNTVATCMEAVVGLLAVVLKDREQPESLISIIDVLGILTGNLDCWDSVPEETIFAILEEFMHSSRKPTRNQLAKVMRLVHADKVGGPVLHHVLEDDRLGLNEEQRAAVVREIFDVKTIAGQVRAEQMMEIAVQEEQTPADIVPPDQQTRKHAEALVAAIHEAYLRARNRPRVLVMGRISRALCRCFAEKHNSCQVVLGETTLDRLNKNDLGASVRPILLPAPQGVENDPELASQDNFDLVITGEPMGYYDVSEYADKLRPFIKRREKEDDKASDQVQWVCIELRERIEDARDDMYSAGYYKAEHDKGFEPLRKAALKMDHDVALFSLPSSERENRRRCADQRALERKTRRERQEEAEARKEEENEQRRSVLFETLFDTMLSPPEVSSLPVAFELGAPPSEAELAFFWLHGNAEDPEVHRSLLEELVTTSEVRLRVIAATFPEGRSHWYRWSDEVAVNYGMEFYEMSEGPYDEAMEKAKKEPAKNISFGKPSFEEMLCVEDLEPCCKQLLNLADEEAAILPTGARMAFGGFAQGGSVAVYSALSHTASDEVQSRLRGVMPCCSGVPVFHFLAPKMQKACLDAKDQGVDVQPIRVFMAYGKADSEVKESFVETTRDMYKRFDFPVTLCRFAGTDTNRFPENVQGDLLRKALKSWTKPLLTGG